MLGRELKLRDLTWCPFNADHFKQLAPTVKALAAADLPAVREVPEVCAGADTGNREQNERCISKNRRCAERPSQEFHEFMSWKVGRLICGRPTSVLKLSKYQTLTAIRVDLLEEELCLDPRCADLRQRRLD
jgi:hypothetical protein